MPLTKTQGLFLSNDELLAHLMENVAKRIQLAEVLPFYPINGDTLRVERAATAADYGVDPLFDPATLSPPLATTEGLALPTQEAKFELKLIVQDVIVEDFISINQSNVNAQVGVQLEAAMRRLLYVFWKKFTAGDQTANPQEFNGLAKLVTGTNTINTKDSTNFLMDLNDLSRLVALVTSNNGRPHALFTGPVGYKQILFAHFAKGLLPDYTIVNVPDSNGGFRKRRQLTFEGIPVYIDDFVPQNDTGLGTFNDGTSIYAMVLGRGGIYGIVPASFGKKMIRVKEVLAASTTNTTYRVYWPVGLCMEKEDALARLRLRPTLATI